jgi:hypothetical protein
MYNEVPPTFWEPRLRECNPFPSQITFGGGGRGIPGQNIHAGIRYTAGIYKQEVIIVPYDRYHTKRETNKGVKTTLVII